MAIERSEAGAAAGRKATGSKGNRPSEAGGAAPKKSRPRRYKFGEAVTVPFGISYVPATVLFKNIVGEYDVDIHLEGVEEPIRSSYTVAEIEEASQHEPSGRAPRRAVRRK